MALWHDACRHIDTTKGNGLIKLINVIVYTIAICAMTGQNVYCGKREWSVELLPIQVMQHNLFS